KTLRSLGEGEIYFTVRENSDACPSQKKEPDDLPDIFTPLQLPNIKATQRLSPHDLMEAHAAPVSPALKVSTEDPEYPRHLGNLFHEVMEYQWWHSEHAPNISTLIKEKYPSKYLKKLQTDIREHLECFKESSFFAIVNQLPSSKLFTECPLMAMAELEDEKILLQGVADLVYESEGQWHVLDYKSSYDANREEAYLLQLKCYQWMLHANYGIKALAHIFYSDCGKSVSNAWSPSLSKEIFKTEILKNHPHSLENIPKLPVKPGKNEKTLFIHPTRRAAEEYKLFLSKQEVNHPGIKHMTLNQLLLIGLNDKKRLTPTAAWLLVKKSSEDMEIELSQGQHQLITEAFQKADENDGIILDEWQTLFKHYLSLRKDLNYLNDLEIITNYPYNFFDETRIILTDTWSVRHRDYLFLKMISEHCKGNFYYRKDSSGQFMNQAYNFSEKDLEKNKYFHRLPDTKDLRNPVILFRNPREEIEAIAENILKNYQSEKIENIKIALADMNGWMPTLSRILDLHGIPWYNNVGKNLLIHPLGILALDLLKMITARENCEWSAIYHFFSSPLVENSLSLSEIDLWAGTKDITKLRYILSEGKYNSEKWDFDKKLENLKDLLEKEG
ncbi:MAG: PD-(D/E)XK nuclease family protein, partial [Candidatus Marinimicrobia bacterium]|nr:PD-(D/E)XK nuclease family protein [Candidatus Neomarinimicrobiota bacterium]